jgi:copper chaperone CopZ
MGILDALSEMCPATLRARRRIKKRPQLTTVEMKVRIDCEGCERRIRKAVHGMKGVTGVEVLPKQNKVAVTGYIDDPSRVMRRVARKTGKKVEPWPYVPYDVVPHPYAPGAYDKKAPPGYVRNVVADPDAAPLARASSTEVKYTSAFSDDNPNAACTIM